MTGVPFCTKRVLIMRVAMTLCGRMDRPYAAAVQHINGPSTANVCAYNGEQTGYVVTARRAS